MPVQTRLLWERNGMFRYVWSNIGMAAELPILRSLVLYSFASVTLLLVRSSSYGGVSDQRILLSALNWTRLDCSVLYCIGIYCTCIAL